MDATPPRRRRPSLDIESPPKRRAPTLPEPEGLPIVLNPFGCAARIAAPEALREAVDGGEDWSIPAASSSHTLLFGDDIPTEAEVESLNRVPANFILDGSQPETQAALAPAAAIGIAAVPWSLSGPESFDDPSGSTPRVGAIMSLRGPGGRASKTKVEIMEMGTLQCQVRLLASGSMIF